MAIPLTKIQIVSGLLEVLVKAFLANIAVYKERKHCISEIPYLPDTPSDNKSMTTKTTSYIVTNAAMGKFLKRGAFILFDSLCNKVPDPKPCFALKPHGLADWLTKPGTFLSGFSGFLMYLKTDLGI